MNKKELIELAMFLDEGTDYFGKSYIETKADEWVGNIADKPAVSSWVAVTDALPKPLQTVWLTNGEGWIALGCRVVTEDGWHWSQSNGVIYIENGEIVSECESEDLDVKYWHELPKPISQ